MFKRIAQALWQAALSFAGRGGGRKEVRDAIRKRADELKKLGTATYYQADAMARRALRAAAAAKKMTASPNSLPPPPNAVPASTPRAAFRNYHYRVVVTYQDPDTGDTVNGVVDVKGKGRLTASEAVDIALNSPGGPWQVTPPSPGSMSKSRRERFPQYVPISAQLITISRS